MYSLLQRSWWVFAFVGLLSLFYMHGIYHKRQEYTELKGRMKALEKDRLLALEEQKELLLQIQSQNDPAWIELVLKRSLGMVPDGQVKVYFERP